MSPPLPLTVAHLLFKEIGYQPYKFVPVSLLAESNFFENPFRLEDLANQIAEAYADEYPLGTPSGRPNTGPPWTRSPAGPSGPRCPKAPP